MTPIPRWKEPISLTSRSPTAATVTPYPLPTAISQKSELTELLTPGDTSHVILQHADMMISLVKAHRSDEARMAAARMNALEMTYGTLKGKYEIVRLEREVLAKGFERSVRAKEMLERQCEMLRGRLEESKSAEISDGEFAISSALVFLQLMSKTGDNEIDACPYAQCHETGVNVPSRDCIALSFQAQQSESSRMSSSIGTPSTSPLPFHQTDLQTDVESVLESERIPDHGSSEMSLLREENRLLRAEIDNWKRYAGRLLSSQGTGVLGGLSPEQTRKRKQSEDPMDIAWNVGDCAIGFNAEKRMRHEEPKSGM